MRTLLAIVAALVVLALGDHAAPEPRMLPPSTGDSAGKVQSKVNLGALLGPLVINKDGTTARIKNWQSMTALEKERTLRIVGARNRQRMARLRAAEAAGADSAQANLRAQSGDASADHDEL